MSNIFRRKPKESPGILPKESPYRQKLIDLCIEHEIPLEETYYGDVLHYVRINNGGFEDAQWTTDVLGRTQDPYRVFYDSLMRKFSRRVVKLV